MKPLLFLLFSFQAFALGSIVTLSVPKLVHTSTANFTSVSNSDLSTPLLTCPANHSLYSVTLTFTTTGKIDVCNVSDIVGGCSTAGSTTNTSAIDLDIDDVVILGIQPDGSHSASELTTGTKVDGTFIAIRQCASSDFFR